MQKHSKAEERFEQREVEPNSSFGQAFRYLLGNWALLTRFLETAGVALDNNPAERSLRRYAAVGKNLSNELNLPIAPYAGVAYSTYEDRFLAIGGLNINFTANLSSQIIFDGVKVHPALNYNWGRHVFTFLLAQGKNPGVSYSISF